MISVPFFYQGTFAFTVVKYSPLKYNNEYGYPWWGNVIGWILALSSMLCTPLGVLVKLYHTPGTLREVSYTSSAERVPASVKILSLSNKTI